MGKQVHFYVLPEDCAVFVRFVQEHDPEVRFIPAESVVSALAPTDNPCVLGHTWYMWNRSVIKNLWRRRILQESEVPVYRIHTSEPVIELHLPAITEWNGKPALTQGRIYASFDRPSESMTKWFAALASWIRRNYARNPNASLGGYVGPAALAWQRNGGIFLPTFKPPITPTWTSLIEHGGSTKVTPNKSRRRRS
jgi:hypothetical protein